METTKEKSAHTPGPWVVKHDKNGLPFIGVASDPWTYLGTVATVEQEKDARLIAAAPEMYELLRDLSKVIENLESIGANLPYYFKDDMSMSDKVREVLAKVEGGEG